MGEGDRVQDDGLQDFRRRPAVGNLGWLAGRSHEGVLMCRPAVFEGEEGNVAGNFIFVLWENLPTPC
jgi:hypothetical protein